MEGAIIALVSVAVGTALAAGLQEWRARNDADRTVLSRRRERTADYNLRRLTDTRRKVYLDADYFLAYAAASDADLEVARVAGHTSGIELADSLLIGDDKAVLGWTETWWEVVGRGRMKSRDQAQMQAIYDARDVCLDAIDEQIRRALNDEPLMALRPETRAAVGRAIIADQHGIREGHPDR